MDLPNHHVSPARSAAARPVETFTRLFGSLLLFVYHCFDRVVINGYLSGLSRPGQVVHFFQKVVGEPVIGKEVLSRRTNYQKSVESFASNHGIGLEWAEPKVRKEDYVRPALRRMERAGRHGVYFILKSMARRFARQCPALPPATPTTASWLASGAASRTLTSTSAT